LIDCWALPLVRLKHAAVTAAGSRASLKTIWIDGCTDTVVAPEMGEVEITVGIVESFASDTFAEAL
jgi:hypothetical protein